MPNFQCPGCSAKLKLTAKHLGRKIKCPKCETVSLVPADLDVVDANLVESIDDYQLQQAPFASQPQSSAASPAPSKSYSSNYSAPYHPASYAAPAPQPTKRAPQKRSKPQTSSASYSSNVDWNQVGMGVLMMVGAAVWFVLGLAGGVIFYYPPVLLVLGMIAVIKGLLNF